MTLQPLQAANQQSDQDTAQYVGSCAASFAQWFEVLSASSMQRLQQAYPNLDVQTVVSVCIAAYSEPQRHYHTLQHLAECLALFEQVQHLLNDPAAVELALWFHDAVYNSQPSSDSKTQTEQPHSNEVQSAALFRQVCQLGLSASSIDKIANWIEATEQHATTTDSDLQYLLDIDLAILAASSNRFAEYERQIRAEYAWVDAAIYAQKRHEVLTEFAQRQPLYQTVYFQQQLTPQAQNNLKRALSR